MDEWSNWAGAVRCRPAERAEPTSEAEIVALVNRARDGGRNVRVVGTGHSFTPLVATDGVLVSLDAHAGIDSHDGAARQATVRAGTKLHDLGELLLELGLAMENLGDVDVQSLGGALSTGTHGTGSTLRNLPSQAVAFRLVLASGEILECSAESDADAFRAARVSLGALGVLSAAQLQLVPAYRLHERVWRTGVDEIFEGIADRIAAHRHFEFFWFPPKDLVEAKTLQPTDEDPDPLEDTPGERIDWSARVIPSVRELKFNEMEYSVAAERGPDCFAAVRARIRQRWGEVQWPVEYRTLRADDAWLSTAAGRETVTISVHQDARLPFREFFADVEAIFREFEGRPHWGKVHTRTAAELAALYPDWEDFHRVREHLDPDGLFLNDHLREIFG